MAATSVVREYKNMKLAQLDMKRMAAKGFTVASTNQLAQNIGVGRFLALGVFALAFKPKAHIVVVYSGEGTPPTPFSYDEQGREMMAAAWRRLRGK